MIVEKFWYGRKSKYESNYANSKNNTFTVELERIDDLLISNMVSYQKIIY